MKTKIHKKDLDNKVDKLLDYFELSSEEDRPHFTDYPKDSKMAKRLSNGKVFIFGWIGVVNNNMIFVLDSYDYIPSQEDWYDPNGDEAVSRETNILIPRFWLIGTKKEYHKILEGIKKVFPGIKEY
jgi:hypothetical protein